MTSSLPPWHAQPIPAALLLLWVFVLYLIRFASPWRWVAVALAVLLADQATKALEPLFLTPQGGASALFLLGGWVRVDYLWNGEQGFGDAYPYLLPLTLLCAAGLLWFYRWLGRERYRMSAPMEVGCALVLGGLLGILVDRIRLGYTVDFLHFGRRGQFVYNLADLAVFAGGVVLLVRVAHFAVTTRGRGLPLALAPAGLAARARPSRRQRLWIPAALVLVTSVALCLLWRAAAQPRRPPLHEAAAPGDAREVRRLAAWCSPWRSPSFSAADSVARQRPALLRVRRGGRPATGSVDSLVTRT